MADFFACYAFAFICVGSVFVCLNPSPGCHELDCDCGNFWLCSLVTLRHGSVYVLMRISSKYKSI